MLSNNEMTKTHKAVAMLVSNPLTRLIASFFSGINKPKSLLNLLRIVTMPFCGLLNNPSFSVVKNLHYIEMPSFSRRHLLFNEAIEFRSYKTIYNTNSLIII
jgi:hypothetical protein